LLLEQTSAEIAESPVQVFVNPALLDGISDLKRQRWDPKRKKRRLGARPAVCISILYFVSPVLHPAKKEHLYPMVVVSHFAHMGFPQRKKRRFWGPLIDQADWHQRYLSWYQPAPDCCQQELLLTAAVWFR